MNTQKIPLILKAETAIHHGGMEKTGNVKLLRTNTWMCKNGDETIPYVSSNALRGVLRRLGARHLLELVGYKVATPRLYHLLTAGGNLEDGPLDIARVRRGLPLLSLLGGSCMSESFSGKLLASNALPVCSELVESGFVKPVEGYEPPSHYSIVDTVMGTRHDDGEAPLHEDPGAGNVNSQQMIFEAQVFKPGTLFSAGFVLRDASTIEEACLGQLIALWRERPYMAARAAQGQGQVEIQGDVPSPEAYLEFLEQEKELVVDTLRWLDGLRPPTSKR